MVTCESHRTNDLFPAIFLVHIVRIVFLDTDIKQLRQVCSYPQYD
ncbi:hypothetical protein CORMATOL_02607 [Corynebacterium matruchotii ATCC 33806]|uniref:Uncharacterized protein n=1 Tax=Corynebacterium matruchotii ATCC 33806 TaxID=566549 RepID=C0E6H4_9CORY|nr:hypothetical protein CORMATOL_02607 [Corynebacterium matruchotii ATCC 33806]